MVPAQFEHLVFKDLSSGRRLGGPAPQVATTGSSAVDKPLMILINATKSIDIAIAAS
jgi:hypothetical protein